jgi:hypothetical protein
MQAFCEFSLGKALASEDSMSASYEAIFPSLRTVAPASAPAPEWQSPASGASAPTDDSFAHDMMEILNPLQHIPIVSTIYRQMSGDKIGTMERIAGDTLYGGMLGMASSVANVVFEKLTGKDFGDTALAMLGINQDKPTAVAVNAQAAPAAPARVADAAPAQLIPISSKPELSLPAQAGAASSSEDIALMNSLNRKGIGLNRGSPMPASISALDDTKPNALLASLNRSGTGLDLGSVASTEAPVTLLVPSTTKTAAASDANASALMASLNRDGIAPDLGLRAMYAYRKSLATPADSASTAATVH